MKRITDSQIVKHADGSSHEQLYCFGHLWGPAYFRKDSADYKEYISIVQKLKAYEDTGREPEEILSSLQLAEIACLQIRYKKRQELLERAAECIENCYGRETELSEAIRKELN